MKFWRALSDLFPERRRASIEANLRLSEAYRAVFQGTPSREQQMIVLSDLQAQCGFTRVSHPSIASRALWFAEGKRAAYGLIYAHLSLSPSDMEALGNAARREAVQLEAIGAMQ